MRTQSTRSQRSGTRAGTSSHGAGSKSRNEGEGSRSAARDYNQRTARFIRQGKVDKSAAEAERAIKGGERKALLDAEATGRARRRS